MDYIEIQGKTVEDAITEACTRLGATSDQLEYEVIEKGSTGFLGIGAKEAVIRARKAGASDATSKEDKKAEKAIAKEEKKAEKAQEKAEKKAEKAQEKAEKKEENKVEKEINPIDVTPYIEKGENFLNDVFKAMDMEVNIASKAGEDANSMEMEFTGNNMGTLIGKRGQTLDSLQYLTSLVINEESPEYIRVKLDTENYRERRKATLENLAKNMGNKVKKTHRSVKLDPMNPYERRIIHSSLQQISGVDTHSEGEEPYRKVVITPKKG